jgi:tetraacyldisaccharide 4'-kinase
MKLQNIIEKHWYKTNNLLLSSLLLPACLIFYIISRIRYYFYKYNIFKSYKLSVPVIIVGNISVGGVGKTPLTKMLASELENKGIAVGIILRGYTGSASKDGVVVLPNMSSSKVGDEALIYAQNNFKVAIGSNRYQAGLKLLDAYPQIQLIIADDGLQHYKLQRDFEIAVVDATRLFGNHFVLPMGPLRETISRLNSVDAVVINGEAIPQASPLFDKYQSKLYRQQIIFDKIYNPVTNTTALPSQFTNQKVCAMAAIGNPSRFFNLLESLGIMPAQTLVFPDHHQYQLSDIPQNTTILVTEKDYTKLSQLKNLNIWVVYIKAQLNNVQLLNQIKNSAQL